MKSSGAGDVDGRGAGDGASAARHNVAWRRRKRHRGKKAERLARCFMLILLKKVDETKAAGMSWRTRLPVRFDVKRTCSGIPQPMPPQATHCYLTTNHLFTETS